MRPVGTRKESFEMNEFTNDEMNLLCIYNAGTRQATIAALTKMRGYLQDDEIELREMTDGALAKLERVSDADWDGIDLYPDF